MNAWRRPVPALIARMKCEAAFATSPSNWSARIRAPFLRFGISQRPADRRAFSF